MNIKLIIFSAVVTALVGAMLGVATSEIARTRFQSAIYREPQPKYAIVGGITGLVVGAAQESIRQLKKKQDEEDQQANL
uniref:Uncharacterized protein n=1 Tax=Cyanothece sp. (strain PCC 7425 / ATCC 29141) TaxID=395961 RepID=B8HPN5_CYAP4